MSRSSAGGAPTQAGPGLAAPTEREALAALRELVGDEEAERGWLAARAAAGVAPGALELDALWRVAQALAQQGGMVGVTARSLGIRIRSYVLLSQKQGRP